MYHQLGKGLEMALCLKYMIDVPNQYYCIQKDTQYMQIKKLPILRDRV